MLLNRVHVIGRLSLIVPMGYNVSNGETRPGGADGTPDDKGTGYDDNALPHIISPKMRHGYIKLANAINL